MFLSSIKLDFSNACSSFLVILSYAYENTLFLCKMSCLGRKRSIISEEDK